MKNVPCRLLFQIVICTSLSAQEKNPAKVPTDSISPRINLWFKPVLKDNKNVLQWSLTVTKKNVFYVIERSSDGNHFEVIGAIKESGQRDSFEFVDERPVNQKNYYRIKISGSEYEELYSEVITINNNNGFECRFYPNPVDKLLIVRSALAGELQIADPVSRVRIRQALKQGLQTVDVSTLERGIYFITFYENATNKVLTEKLIKN
jgi:hypothetical protein